ncbi:putative hydroxyacid oxidase 1 [Apostichopus japonicus]|uniref:Putative hydroxyacid oxidase 1 n=1 Tax=Stichopus japonicus TaxID=307972 RepID=A0A2G8LJS6_STIJA|nr:putative hydroxyacid oxidase 1 [Apostichopus japonicus]
MIYSSVSNLRIDEFGSKVPPNGLHWAQTYLFKDKRNTLHIVRNAEKYGFKAIVVTADSPVDYISSSGRGEEVDEQIVPSEMTITISPNVAYLKGKARESRKYSDHELWNPSDGTAYFEAFCAPTWEDLAWLKGQTKLPIVLKGILTAKAAKLAVKAGVDAIIVSCHGGRQLPGVQPPLFALPEVLEAVKGSKIEVYLDGEIRFGSEVVKALALGARAVFIGRPVLWGLAVKRKEGVKRVLQILEDEFKTVLTMCGCSSLQDVDSSLVKLKSLF